mmetsp:Transcript_66890/g.178412  ORF Transcript_66890/g.178412 Transcript_66890/m.178412 type:complete len:80 (+) Transcript_66890:545-784(+)
MLAKPASTALMMPKKRFTYMPKFRGPNDHGWNAENEKTRNNSTVDTWSLCGIGPLYPFNVRTWHAFCPANPLGVYTGST